MSFYGSLLELLVNLFFLVGGLFNGSHLKNQKSTIPVAFWWCSLLGGVITLIYAHHIGSFPFMLAQAVGIIVYSRNLLLINRRQNEKNS